jgi:hypothetical protein
MYDPAALLKTKVYGFAVVRAVTSLAGKLAGRERAPIQEEVKVIKRPTSNPP